MTGDVGKIRVLACTGAGATGRAAYRAAIETIGCDHHSCIAQSHMTQLQTGSWAHAVLGWLLDECTGRAQFIGLQHHNLERLQRELNAAVLSRRSASTAPLGKLQARFASIPCRGQPVCALALALRAD